MMKKVPFTRGTREAHERLTKKNEEKSLLYLNFKRNKWKKIQDKLKRTPITIVYNYSSITLTEDMTKVLNRGLNFCVTPNSVNVTELRADLKTFERKMRWFEFWFEANEANPNNWAPPIYL